VIGLALGGGAARGFAHIGIVRTLIANGIVPNVVVGTSIGAVVGGAYAAGHLDTLEHGRSLQPAQYFQLSRHPPQRLRLIAAAPSSPPSSRLRSAPP
jgi:predicted acylesterase/phospholipase RssA